MKDTFYFSHDYNASMDEKIIKLLSKHGMAGYGVFWRIVENLYNNSNVLQTDYDRIAYDLHIEDTNIIRSIINDFNLFKVNDGYFNSVSIKERLQERDEKSEKAKQSILHRWKKDAPTLDSDTNVSNKDTNVSNKDTNVSKIDTIKERKVKDILPKEKNIPLLKEEEIKEEENPDVEYYNPSDFDTAVKETGTAEPECAAKQYEMKHWLDNIDEEGNYIHKN